MIEQEAVLEALAGVRDPELDEPITTLGFVAGLGIDGDEVAVELRLPTYFCAPNFAYLMVADARKAILAVAGVREARVTLVDHFAGREINAGVAEHRGFQGTFPGEADAELDELRRLFRGKALIARQDRLCRALLARGLAPEQLSDLRLADLPPSPETDLYLERRAELGLDISPGAPFLVNPNGARIPAELVAEYLRRARAVRVSIEGNAEFCRELLSTRYGRSAREEATT
jgi:metal-sulfur cluster biosynthetic enzyme